ncbi:complex I NDUFA9 subunit family protein [Sphingomonas sp. CROZ-RG-20F-R02-07]|uniref:complex I NDUFA9 subunit family protein n=1 Tax=Sphingomonas sp. CROZ-RG-20F-R02-07 TaxID=2914832 RepID=UPI001F5907F5|nr:complex I NDUFA9 subunit family protein [Sphingomonas sp. CROZ-RG-20F-R02-07]
MNDRLVTLIGGGGFLGRYVAQGLLAAGARVRIAQRDPRQAYFLRPQGGLGQTQFVAIDVNRPETVARAVEGSDSVVNLVGILGGNFDRIHVAGARHVAEAARAAGVESLIHVSAIGADARSPSAYGRSKGEGEAAVRFAFADATIMRPSVVFGPEDAFVNRFAGMIAKLPVVPVIRATAKFQPVFVGDVGVAIANAATAPQGTMGKTYELGGPDILAMGALVRWIAGALHRDVAIVDVPDLVGSAIARAGMLPGAPITWDQWLMLQHDNVVSDGMPGLAALGVVPTPLASVAPDWLVRFRRQGRFNRRVEDLAA